jgi:hypothetical protein
MSSLIYAIPYEAPATAANVEAFLAHPYLISKAVFWDDPEPPILTPGELLVECGQRLLDEASVSNGAVYRPRDLSTVYRLTAAHIALCEITR